MKPWLFVLIGALALGCAAGKPKQTMHRIQVGTPDATGWIRAESTQGRFSASFPIPFNDFTVEDGNPAVPAARLDVLGCKSSEGIKFSVTRVSYRKPGQAETFFRTFQSGAALPGGVVSPLRHGGLEAVEVSLSGGPTEARQRIVRQGETLFLCIVEWPKDQAALAAKLAPAFLGSLEVRP